MELDNERFGSAAALASSLYKNNPPKNMQPNFYEVIVNNYYFLHPY
jgi:hypothetical protein